MPTRLLKIDSVDLDAWCTLAEWPPQRMRTAPCWTMRQHWLPTQHEDFEAARVWLASTAHSFVFLAELDDDCIGTRGERHNDPLWELGDIFEVFLHYPLAEPYYEFHVAPNGVTLDLRYPKPYASRANGIKSYLLEKPSFKWRVRVEPELKRWRIAVEIPVAPLVPADMLAQNHPWLISFSRYDCHPSRDPIYSSTSPLTKPDFHRINEWLEVETERFT